MTYRLDDERDHGNPTDGEYSPDADDGTYPSATGPGSDVWFEKFGTPNQIDPGTPVLRRREIRGKEQWALGWTVIRPAEFHPTVGWLYPLHRYGVGTDRVSVDDVRIPIPGSVSVLPSVSGPKEGRFGWLRGKV